METGLKPRGGGEACAGSHEPIEEPDAPGDQALTPVIGRDQDETAGLVKIAHLALAPVFGSRLLFPARFDRAVHAHDSNPGFINPAHAFWYFGRKLTLSVDPATLRQRLSDHISDERGSRWIGRSFLDATDWRPWLAPLLGSPVHREMVQLVAAGLDYRSTDAYRSFVRKLKKGRSVRRSGMVLDSVDRVESYFEYCCGLVRSIQAHGVMPRAGLRRARERGISRGRPIRFDLAEADIGVAIDADGSLVRHLGGKHRTAIAQALELPELPVRVAMVHPDWLRAVAESSSLPPHLALARGIEGLPARLRH